MITLFFGPAPPLAIIAIALSSQVTAWQVRDTVEQGARRARLSGLATSGRHGGHIA